MHSAEDSGKGSPDPLLHGEPVQPGSGFPPSPALMHRDLQSGNSAQENGEWSGEEEDWVG